MKRTMRRPSLQTLNLLVENFNLKYPVGTEVVVKRDSGEKLRTKTRSAAWMLSGHTPVIMVEGISGAYALDRVRKA